MRQRLNFFGLIQGKWFREYVWAWAILVLPFACFGQGSNVSTGGRFSADIVVGCAPLTVNITELDNFGNISRQYIYEPNFPVTNSTTHTFARDSVYQIIQIIQNEVPRTDTLTITVHPPDPPQVQIANCRDFSASVKTPGGPYDYYRVYYTPTDSVQVAAGAYATPYDFGGPGQFPVRVKGFYNNGNDSCGEILLTISTLQSLTQPTLNSIETFADNTMLLSASLNPGISYVLEVSANGGAYTEIPLAFQGSQILADQLDPAGNSYCFRLAAYDPCNDEFYYSNELCQVNLSVNFEQYRNNLTWTQPTQPVGWEVLRNGTSLIQSSGVVGSYPDSSLVCNTDYCYQVRVNYSTGFALSQEICGTSFEEQSLAPITGIYSTYQGDELLISWEMGQQVALREFQLLYNTAGNSFSSLSFSSDDNEEIFSNQEFFRSSYSYTVVYQDECQNESPPGPLTSPIFLQASETENNAYTLTWNQYIPLSDGVRQYFVELWGQDMGLISTLPAWDPGIFSLRLSTDLSSVAWVTVRAEGLGVDAGFTSSSNRVPIEYKTDLYLPSAFTPNSDGLNDELRVIGIGVSDFFFSIYNRWGEMVFATSDQTLGWDGTFNGKQAPQGSYHYFVEGRDERGNMIKKSGNFVLLR